MNLRARLIGFSNKNNVIKTIHQCMQLNHKELQHALPTELLHDIFPQNSGIHFDFTQHGKIVLIPEKHVAAHINGEPLHAGQHYPLFLGDKKMLGIGKMNFHIDIFSSNF